MWQPYPHPTDVEEGSLGVSTLCTPWCRRDGESCTQSDGMAQYHKWHRANSSGSWGLVSAMRQHFATFRVPCEVSSDGELVFAASETRDFLQRLRSQVQPISNGWAELGVNLDEKAPTRQHWDWWKFGQWQWQVFAFAPHPSKPDPPDTLSKKTPAEVLFSAMPFLSSKRRTSASMSHWKSVAGVVWRLAVEKASVESKSS